MSTERGVQLHILFVAKRSGIKDSCALSARWDNGTDPECIELGNRVSGSPGGDLIPLRFGACL
jgi:hypothetical protein